MQAVLAKETEEEGELDYKKLYEEEKRKNAVLSNELEAFNMPGKTKLFYALNKQQNDLADLLNKTDIKHLSLDDPKDRSVERLKTIWASIGTLAPLVDLLGVSAGISGMEQTDMDNRVPFIETVAIKRD